MCFPALFHKESCAEFLPLAQIAVFREVMKEMIEQSLIHPWFFTCFFTLVEHMLKVLIVPGRYPEHLPALEMKGSTMLSSFFILP